MKCARCCIFSIGKRSFHCKRLWQVWKLRDDHSPLNFAIYSSKCPATRKKSQHYSFKVRLILFFASFCRFHRITAAFIEVESEHNLRRLTDREQQFVQCLKPSIPRENDAQNQVPMDNTMESDYAKAELVQSTSFDPANLGKFACVRIEISFKKFRILF